MELQKGIYIAEVLYSPPRPSPSIMSTPTEILNAFRARLAHHLGQQHQLLAAGKTIYQASDAISNTGSIGVLPLEFPNEAFEHGGFIEFHERQARYVFQYVLAHAPPVQAWESHVWRVSAKRLDYLPGESWTSMGYVEFDSRVYIDATPMVPLVDGELMLRLMVHSVQKGYAVRLASRVEASLSPSGVPEPWNVEFLEVRSGGAAGESLVFELGKRLIPKRSCTVASCRAWLPAAGPDVCIVHLLG
ncbi:hypothetical protein B0H15DRAFT_843638 [Mycena belliarum]|uniref:Uncharacterized protein n=1 Tax=Mycena belliarum TaxID=1033014 RepID=A0AAD6XLN9_9AGAR|nr:hypothetical protein B0H15DRAFT_843638 [Mycena belliae]